MQIVEEAVSLELVESKQPDSTRAFLSLCYALGAAIVLGVMFGLFLAYENARHPAFLPILACALVTFPVVFVWLLGKRETFDPFSLSCIMLVQLTVVTPMIHLILREYGNYPFTENTEDLMGRTAWLCFFSLFPFFIGYHLKIGQHVGGIFFKRPAIISLNRLNIGITILFCVALAVRIYARFIFEGVLGATWETRMSFGEGKGILLMLADSILAAIVLWFASKVLRKHQQGKLNSVARTQLILVFLVALLGILFFVGLRGSRSLILVYVVWLAGIYHFTVKRIRPATVLLAFVCLLPPLHLYSLYKSYGPKAIPDIFDPQARAALERGASRSFLGMIVGDLGRMNVWMFIKQEIDNGNYPLRWGQTYYAAMCAPIPRVIFPGKPFGMNEVIADMQSGKGFYAALEEKSNAIAGLLGEAYANFKAPGVMFFMFAWGIIIKSIKTLADRWRSDLLLSAFLPIIIFFAVQIFQGDTMVLVNGSIKEIVPALIVVWLARIPLAAQRSSDLAAHYV